MKRHHILTILTAIIAVSLFCGAAAATTNLITNGDFSNGMSGWSGSGASVSNGVCTLEFSLETYDSGSAYIQTQSAVNLDYKPTITFSAKYDNSASTSSEPTFTVYLIPVDSSKTTYSSTFDLSTSYSTYTYSVPSAASGNYYIKLESSGSSRSTVKIYTVNIDDVAATVNSPPTISSVSCSPSSFNLDSYTTIQTSWSGDTPTASGQMSLVVTIKNSGGTTVKTETIDLYGTTSPNSYVYTPSAVGTYTITVSGKSAASTSASKSTSITVLERVPATPSLSATPTTIETGNTVSFTPIAGSGGGSITSWDFYFEGASGGATNYASTATFPVTHTYSTTGTYSAYVIAKGPGGNSAQSASVTITVGDTYVSIPQSQYYIGQTSSFTATYSITPYDSSSTYTMQWWKLDSYGNYSEKLNEWTLTSSSGSKTVSISSITQNSNCALIIVKGASTVIASDTVTIRYNGQQLTVNIVTGSSPIGSEATVELQESGSTVYTKTTSTGSVFFAPVTSGHTYVIAVTATGYVSQSQQITIDGDTTVTIDMGGGSSSAGMGQQYEPISGMITVRSEYGSPLYNCQVKLEDAGTSIVGDFLSQIWASLTAQTLSETTQTLYTDSMGQVTFIVLPNQRYKVTFTYSGKSYTEYYTFGASQPNYQYVFKIGTSAVNLNEKLSAAASSSGAEITAIFNNTENVANTRLTITVKDKNDATVGSWSGGPLTGTTTQTFTITGDYYNQEYTVIFAATTDSGQWNKTVSVYMNGPRLDFGIPAELLIWIAIFLAFAFGGVFSRITASIGCLAVSIWLWICYGIGWLWQLEQSIGGTALTISLMVASALSVAFMLAEGR